MSMAVPDSLGPMTGYRLWRVDMLPPANAQQRLVAARNLQAEVARLSAETVPVLAPIAKPGPWPPGEDMRAEPVGCGPDIAYEKWATARGLVLGRNLRQAWERAHADGAPAKGCLCGIWVLREPRIDIGMGIPGLFRTGDVAAGEVRFWGRAYEYELGWRVQHARPTVLYRLWDPKHEERMAALAERYGMEIREHPVLAKQLRGMESLTAGQAGYHMYYQRPWVTPQVLGLHPTSRRLEPPKLWPVWAVFIAGQAFLLLLSAMGVPMVRWLVLAGLAGAAWGPWAIPRIRTRWRARRRRRNLRRLQKRVRPLPRAQTPFSVLLGAKRRSR